MPGAREQVATACAATVKALTMRQERLAGSLSLVKGTASLADAKCDALGAEIARLYRDSGLRRPRSSGGYGSAGAKKATPRVPKGPVLPEGCEHAYRFPA